MFLARKPSFSCIYQKKATIIKKEGHRNLQHTSTKKTYRKKKNQKNINKQQQQKKGMIIILLDI